MVRLRTFTRRMRDEQEEWSKADGGIPRGGAFFGGAGIYTDE